MSSMIPQGYPLYPAWPVGDEIEIAAVVGWVPVEDDFTSFNPITANCGVASEVDPEKEDVLFYAATPEAAEELVKDSLELHKRLGT